MTTILKARIIDWEDLFHQFNTTFHEGIRLYGTSNFPKINAWLEKAETSESKNKLYIQAALSGYKLDEIEIGVDATEGTLTFEYKKTDEDEKQYYLREIKKSSFCRVIPIHRSVNLNKYDTKYEDGLLTIIFDLKTDEELGKYKIKIGDK